MSIQNRNLNFNQAISEATVMAMKKNKNVFILGESVASATGVFGTTRDAYLTFGNKRVIETPLSENAFTGLGIGAALSGLRPIMVHDRNDFLMLAMDQIVNHMAKISYIHQGKIKLPIVIRALIGRGWGQGPQHSQSLQAIFSHIPGLQVVMPSTPFTAKGLLLQSIMGSAPVIFLEHRWLYSKNGTVPQKYYTLPFGKAFCHKKGKDLTIIATSLMVYEALEAADILSKKGIDAEIIDPLSLQPLDEKTIITSVKKTKRVIIADTGWRRFGVTAEISAVIAETVGPILKTPIVRIGLPHAPTPTSSELEKHFYPSSKEIVRAALMLCSRKKSISKNLKNEKMAFTGPF